MKFTKARETSVRITHSNDCMALEKEALIQRLSRVFKKVLAEEMVLLSHCKTPFVMIWIMKRKKQLSFIGNCGLKNVDGVEEHGT